MKILITLATVLFSLALNAQEITGTYWEGPDSISFNDNRIIFSVRGNDALGVVFTGEGTYDIVDDFIVIQTEEYKGVRTKIETTPSEKKDTIQLQLFDENGYSLKGIRAEFLNKKNKSIGLSLTDERGIVLFKSDPKINAIRVSDLLYDKATFDYEAGTDYTVHLAKNRVLEDKTVVFKLIEGTDSKLTIKLLSTDSKSKDPSVSQLKRLDKKTKAIVDRFRLFEKPEF